MYIALIPNGMHVPARRKNALYSEQYRISKCAFAHALRALAYYLESIRKYVVEEIHTHLKANLTDCQTSDLNFCNLFILK